MKIDQPHSAGEWRIGVALAIGVLAAVGLLRSGAARAQDYGLFGPDSRDKPQMEFRLGLFVEQGDLGSRDQNASEDLGGLGIQMEYLEQQYGVRLSYSNMPFDEDNAFRLTDGRLAVFGHTGLEDFRAEAGAQLKRISLELDEGFRDPRILDEHFGFGAFIGGQIQLGAVALYTETGYTFYSRFNGLDLAAGGRLSFGAFEVFAELREQYLRGDDGTQELSTARMGISFAFTAW